MNPVHYPTPFEKYDVIKPAPEAIIQAELARLRDLLAAHLLTRPHWHQINERMQWVMAKDRIALGIDILEGQIRNRWHSVLA